MIVTEQKSFEEILETLKDYKKIFLVGCGECATTCKSGGEKELLEVKKRLENEGKIITGMAIPEAPCISSQIKTALAKNMASLKDSSAILVLACGSGVQSVKENSRLNLRVLPACNTLFGALVDSAGNFKEVCSACGECVLELTAGICPLTRCAKGLLNGPCGGVDKGKCEVDKEKDCAWVLIFKERDKYTEISGIKKILPPKDYSKAVKPRRLTLLGNGNSDTQQKRQ